MPRDSEETFVGLRTQALTLVRQIKDLAFDDAMLLLLSELLALRQRVEQETLTDIDVRLRALNERADTALEA